MLVPKPTQSLDWTDGAPTKVVEPSAGKKLAGWQPLEKPPAEFFNYLFYTSDLWHKYLDDQIEAFKAVGTFFDAVVGTGGTHADLADLMADTGIADIKHVLVATPTTLTATVDIDQDDMAFWFKPQASVSAAPALATGLNITASRVRIMNGRFLNFTSEAILMDAASTNCMIFNNFLAASGAGVTDNGTNNNLTGNLTEV